jgi:endonuclease/exonuclease/phosphatase (EEP) superfamily protein YafD
MKHIDKLLIALILACLGAPFARWHFLLEIISNIRQWLFFAVVLLSIYALIRYRRWRYVAYPLLASLITFAIVPAPVLTAPSPTSQPSATLRIFHANILRSNTELTSLITMIRAHRPDIVSLQETSDISALELKLALPEYHFHCKTLDSPFGLCAGFLSPPHSIRIFYAIPDTNIPTIQASIRHHRHLINLFFVHPPPPMNTRMFNQRTTYYNRLQEIAKPLKHLIIVGDMNISQWSPLYQSFARSLDLHNTLSGWATTWSATSIVPLFQLDHILIPASMSVQQATVLEEIGSDHYPIMSDIGLP